MGMCKEALCPMIQYPLVVATVVKAYIALGPRTLGIMVALYLGLEGLCSSTVIFSP